MSSRKHKKPPAPRSPVNKNRVVDDAPLDKRRKIGTGRMMASTNEKEVAVAAPETEGSERENIEFTKEEVDALLNERFKGKNLKEKQDWMTEHWKKLNLCLKWCQKSHQDLVEERNNLRKMLDSSGKRCHETEAAVKSKEEELYATIAKLETESLTKEESEKLDALDCQKREKQGRMALETTRDSLKEVLGRAQ